MPENEYPWVRKWGALLGSHPYYIERQVHQAREEGAPQDATHRNHDGGWYTIADVKNNETRRQLGLPELPERLRVPGWGIVEITGEELDRLLARFDAARLDGVDILRVMVDGGLKYKFGAGGWSPPLGELVPRQ